MPAARGLEHPCWRLYAVSPTPGVAVDAETGTFSYRLKRADARDPSRLASVGRPPQAAEVSGPPGPGWVAAFLMT